MNKVRIVTYNIDGLPDTLDLNDLPWFLKPIALVYKLFKKTTKIQINNGTNRSENMCSISEYLNTLNADIIAVQEDFNYHNELMSSLKGYKDNTHTGDISLDNLFFKTEWKPFPRFKADGLNLITNNATVNAEDIVRWNKSNGYISHANDKLTYKGFRYYNITVNNTDIDLYILHMDADFYNPDSCTDITKDVEARKDQIEQLIEYIKQKNSTNPIIITGDTNSTDDYEWDRENIKLLLNEGFVEAKPNTNDLDRLFYKGDIKILSASFGRDDLSDHKPLIVDIEV